MTKIQSALVSAALAIGMSAPASAAQFDPEAIIYRFPGVRDDGGAANVGVATVFVCTNFSGETENIRFVTRHNSGVLAGNNTVVAIAHVQTASVSTHFNAPYISTMSMFTGKIDLGTTAIAATSTNIICTGMVLDAANAKPDGVALRGIRFSPAPGSQE